MSPSITPKIESSGYFFHLEKKIRTTISPKETLSLVRMKISAYIFFIIKYKITITTHSQKNVTSPLRQSLQCHTPKFFGSIETSKLTSVQRQLHLTIVNFPKIEALFILSF